MKKELEEQFNKLSQLDRIEYRQKEDRINKKYEYSAVNYTNTLFVLLGFGLILVEILYFQVKGVLLFSKANIISILYAWIICLAVSIVGDVILYILENKAREKLNSEYFKLEIKKK